MRHLPGLLLASAIVGAFGSSIVEGQAPKAAASRATVSVRPAALENTRRSTQLICTLSAFYTIDPSSRTGSETNLDGRGLLTCHNDAGFTTETPVLADLQAQVPESLTSGGEIAISGNTSSFVIPREINQIMDDYDARNPARASAGNEQPSSLFRGKRNDLVIEMTFTSRNTSSIDQLRVTGMRLHFDEAAPDFF